MKNTHLKWRSFGSESPSGQHCTNWCRSLNRLVCRSSNRLMYRHSANTNPDRVCYWVWSHERVRNAVTQSHPWSGRLRYKERATESHPPTYTYTLAHTPTHACTPEHTHVHTNHLYTHARAHTSTLTHINTYIYMQSPIHSIQHRMREVNTDPPPTHNIEYVHT